MNDETAVPATTQAPPPAPAAPPITAPRPDVHGPPVTPQATGPGLPGVCVGLAQLPGNAHLDAKALAKILGRTVRTIDRATARAELPRPVRFLGRRVWLVRTILEHLQARQDEALEAAAKHERKILQKSS
ncbi:MAG: hypothetical protein ABSE73_23590 [Planctomycetota bacterium]